MSMKKIIIETIGPVVEKHGFTYGLDKDYSDIWSWGFTREVNGVKQMIIISRSQFSKIVGLAFETTVWPQSRVAKEKISELIHEYNEARHPRNAYPYETDDDFREIMVEFAGLIKKYGFKILEAKSVEEKIDIIPTVEMADKLMTSHVELNEKFIRENKVNVTDRSRENILEWFNVVEKKLVELKERPYEDVQEMLVEIAAFVGEQLRKDLGGEWEQSDRVPQYVGIKGMNSFLEKGTSILGKVVHAWKNQSIKRMKQDYIFILDGKLPMTIEQIREYTANQNKYYE